jgi:hypothetical protein
MADNDLPEKTARPANKDRRTFLKSASLVPAALYLDGCATGAVESNTPADPIATGESMTEFVVPPLDTVRLGLIGMGRRGLPMLRLLLAIDGVEITAISDPYAPAIEAAKELFAELGLAAPASSCSRNRHRHKMPARPFPVQRRVLSRHRLRVGMGR